MDKEQIIDKLKSNEFVDFINKYNIITVILFGSINGNDFNEESDVDLAMIADTEIELDKVLDIELFLQNLLDREIDVLDLRNDEVDLFVKINILNNGKVIYSLDNNEALEAIYNETDRIYKENENFMYFRRGDVLY
ncbi:nucleotidyltransferase domain-containing protein [Clostridium sp. YIM B02555]|uniref:type VII toxin-antitoxin system MntA family adenylyltransferase antitoxin n=1 Tax=Clostridium sp. YIM B02555 TaxID=2911968 RepID=UPI001EEF5024|nr:nucleotidyltransferase domain-containing protein [Clostridium sp. YIM B02555]